MQTTIPSLTVRTHHQATNNSHRKKQWLHWVRRRRPQDQEHLHQFTQDHHHRAVWRWDKSILKIATQGNFQAQKKTKQTSHNEDKVFIFEEELKFYEAITKSFEAKIGNPEICQAVVIEQPNQRRELLRELANLVKNLFRDVDLEGDDEERKFAIHNLHLHSKPCINHIVDMVRTISSQEELAVF